MKRTGFRNIVLIIPMALILVTILFSCIGSNGEKKSFTPGQVWNDAGGNPINAHGGGIMFHQGTYYWYGEYKKGQTRLVPGQSWECYRVDAGGISCYSSTNLTDWKFEGIVLKPELEDTTSDIHVSRVIERPKVIYNEKTGKFVMWFHADSEDYSYARAGVAVSDSPVGPFRYLGSIRPGGDMSRDMTLFRDKDGRAYHIFSSESNATMHVSLLTEDYLQPSGIVRRILVGRNREAPAMFEHEGRYYLITSGCTGWSPNAAILATADSVLGDWRELYNPCSGVNSDSTFSSQGTFMLPLVNKPGRFIFMADRWKKTDLEDSRYVWLPAVFRGDSLVIEWKESWSLD
ncbi:MAG: glycoside hydrolase family 43 protein [Bacteroidales bacterium]